MTEKKDDSVERISTRKSQSERAAHSEHAVSPEKTLLSVSADLAVVKSLNKLFILSNLVPEKGRSSRRVPFLSTEYQTLSKNSSFRKQTTNVTTAPNLHKEFQAYTVEACRRHCG